MLGSWIMGGVTLGIPAIIGEFSISLNEAIDGLISWIVLTLGLGVRAPASTSISIHYSELRRTSSGPLSPSTLASDLSSSLSPSSPLAAQFGVQRPNHGTVSKRPESLAPLPIRRARVFAPALRQTFSSFMNEASGWEFTSSGFWVGSALAVSCPVSSSTHSAGAGISGYSHSPASIATHCFLQVGAIASGVCALAFFFFFPETQFKRAIPVSAAIAAAGPEKDLTDSPSDEVPVDEPTTGLTGTKKTFVQQLNPFNPIDKDKSLLLLFLKPLPLFAYPAVFYGSVAFGTSLAFFLAGLTVTPSVYQAPPYNFSPAINGLINIPSFIGHFLGAFAGGWLTDRIAEMQARKNNGIFEPEFRLMALILPLFIFPAGCLMYNLFCHSAADQI